MASANKNTQLPPAAQARLTQALLSAGYELVLCQYLRGAQTLRLFVDRAQADTEPVVAEPTHTPYQSGILLADCQLCSAIASKALDGEASLPPAGDYQLEVSSPGIERPLCRPRDYARFEGHRAAFKLNRPSALRLGLRAFEAEIGTLEGGTVALATEQGTVELAVADIERAHLVADWDALTSR